jgi:hypothetical protein
LAVRSAVHVLVMRRPGEVAMALDEAATSVSLWAARTLESVGHGCAARGTG